MKKVYLDFSNCYTENKKKLLSRQHNLLKSMNKTLNKDKPSKENFTNLGFGST